DALYYQIRVPEISNFKRISQRRSRFDFAKRMFHRRRSQFRAGGTFRGRRDRAQRGYEEYTENEPESHVHLHLLNNCCRVFSDLPFRLPVTTVIAAINALFERKVTRAIKFLRIKSTGRRIIAPAGL